MSNKLKHLSEVPQYYNYLSENDKMGYNSLRLMLATPDRRNRRNKSVQSFAEIIYTIKSYIIRNDGHDWTRALVCGVVWLTYMVVVNTRQLRILLGRCKSSINGSFQSLGYIPIVPDINANSQFINSFSIFKDNSAELRQWTFRSLPTPPPPLNSGPVTNIMHPNYYCLVGQKQKGLGNNNNNNPKMALKNVITSQLREKQKHTVVEKEKFEESSQLEYLSFFSDNIAFLSWELQHMGIEPDGNDDYNNFFW